MWHVQVLEEKEIYLKVPGERKPDLSPVLLLSPLVAVHALVVGHYYLIILILRISLCNHHVIRARVLERESGWQK